MPLAISRRPGGRRLPNVPRRPRPLGPGGGLVGTRGACTVRPGAAVRPRAPGRTCPPPGSPCPREPILHSKQETPRRWGGERERKGERLSLRFEQGCPQPHAFVLLRVPQLPASSGEGTSRYQKTGARRSRREAPAPKTQSCGRAHAALTQLRFLGRGLVPGCGGVPVPLQVGG